MSETGSLGTSAFQASVQDAEKRYRIAGLVEEDIQRIGEIKNDVLDHIEEHTSAFFDHLTTVGEAGELLRRPELLREARRLKMEHLAAMVGGVYGPSYIEQRLQLSLLYAKAQLDPRMFMGAFQAVLLSISRRVAAHFADDGAATSAHMESLHKVACLDMGVMLADREQTILRQQQAIRELSTPVLQLRDRLLILPIIGLLDSFRARQLTESLLRAVRDRRARVVVMDVTGVATVDSQVANHLIQTITAANLMGAKVIVTGLSAGVAQSLVVLGVDLSMLNTAGDLQGGLEEAERYMGYEIRPAMKMPDSSSTKVDRVGSTGH
jgi:rsbT co-antagonist protein RsbR